MSGTWDTINASFLILEFTGVITIPEDDAFTAMHLPVKCQAVMQKNGKVGNLQVFNDNNRIAIYEATPAIGLHGAVSGLQLPFHSDQMDELIHTAEHLFKIAIARIEL